MDWKERLKHIKLVVLDVDGTMTDGGMYYTAEGEVMKRFHVHDGMGINLLHRAGIKVAILTADKSALINARAKKLNIEYVILGCKAKKSALEELSSKLALSLEQIAYIGDDINDEGAMRISGISVCPANALPVIRSLADYTCSLPGGHGAIREFSEMVLEAQNLPNTLPEDWSSGHLVETVSITQ